MSDDPRAELIARLRQRLDERHRSGLYRAEILDELDAYGRAIAPDLVPAQDYVGPLRSMVHAVTGRRFDPTWDTSSRVPGGELLQRVIAALQRRFAHRIVSQANEFAMTVTDAIDGIVTALEHPEQHLHLDFEAHLAAMRMRIEAIDRAAELGTSAEVMARLERLEAIERSRAFTPFWSNAAFEAEFRGDQAGLAAHYAPLADRLQGPVLEIGCGQGFFLRLLADRGIEARGVELDAELAAAAQADGLDVTRGDGLAALDAVPDASLGAIVLLQVVEHLTPQQVCDLVLLASTKLKHGGFFAAESVNPQSLYVFARAFYLDPTHTNPVHPLYLRFVCEQAGFGSAALEYSSLPAEDETLPADGGELAKRANDLLFGPQDYLLLAQR